MPSSVQAVPSALPPFAGHVGDVPLHASATSQSPVAGRHTVPLLPAGCAQIPEAHSSREHGLVSGVQAVPSGRKKSGGQEVEVPLQVSARSHSPTAERQGVPALPAPCEHAPATHSSTVQTLPSPVHGVPSIFVPSAGHVVLVPVHFSSTSHSLAAARHVEPALPAGCTHEPAWQTSAVHGLASLVQPEPSVFSVSAGQAVAPPHTSARSHSPAAGRHTVAAGAAACVHVVALQTSVVQTLPSLEQAWPFFV
jgi:hypothetical protein